jgi:hypothetical protein
MPQLLFHFDDYPAEREAIGRMLIAYGEIEFGLLTCLGAAMGGDLDTAVRVLFRVRGEGARIEVADAIIRPAFTKVGLGGKWSNAYGAAKICKGIRNQYAHCHWIKSGEVMTFFDLDQDSKLPEGTIQLTRKAINAVLVAEQQQYFEYCLHLLWFVEPEFRRLAGLESADQPPEPKSLAAPRQYIPYK